MTIYTLQKKKVLEIIEKNGEYICDSRYIKEFQEPNSCFKNAYEWLSKKMDEKNVPHPSDCSYPIWGWYLIAGENKMPNLTIPPFSCYGGDFEGEECVCLELAIPDNEILLSRESWWTVGPLNNSPFFLDDEEREQFYKDCLFKTPDEITKNIEKTWENVIYPNNNVNDCSKEFLYIQGTFWKIRKKDIVNITPYICKYE